MKRHRHSSPFRGSGWMSVSLTSNVCENCPRKTLSFDFMIVEDLCPEYLGLPECPLPGEGCHRWMFGVVNVFVTAGWEDPEIHEWVSYWLTRPEQPREIANTIWSVRARLNGISPPRQGVRCKMARDEVMITRLVGSGPTQVEDFISRSPIDPARASSGTALRALFGAVERTIIFTVEKSQGQLVWSHSTPDEKLDSIVRANRGGAWFLLNPVSGEMQWVDRLQKRTRRSEDNTTSFRHILIESDSMELGLWLSILKQQPLPIVSVTLSGNTSAHAIVRMESSSLEQWHIAAGDIAKRMVPLGACPGSLTAVRLTRLPGVLRGDNGNEQKLIWLNPHPTPMPLEQFSKLR